MTMFANSDKGSTSIGSDYEVASNASDSVVVQGELENHDEVKRLKLSSGFLWSLGISIVIGGQYIGWNETLQSGFGSTLIATVLIASGYCCLISCMAEVSSAIPFGGGSYGIARVTLGFFPGYMVAAMETSQNIVYVASAAITFGEILTEVTGLTRAYEPLYWCFFFVTSLSLQICGGRTFWYMISLMAVASLGLLLVYVFGSIPDFNFNKYALFDRDDETNRWFRDGGVEFMRVMPCACWFYMGVENINLACKDVPNPREQVPRGYLSCMATLVVMSFAVLFCCTSVAPGIAHLMDDYDPLHAEFKVIFHITDRAARAVVLPSIYATCSGFMYCYGKQLKAMSKSGLIHPFFAQPYEGYKMPVNALLLGSFCSVLVALLYYFIAHVTERRLFVLCLLCAFSAYASQFASFIIFRYKFPTIKREFESPLGIAGAVYGFLVFTAAFIGAVGFQEDFTSLYMFLGVVVVAVAYYFWAAQDRQSFSEEEKQVMFRAYLMKSNNDRKHRIKKGKIAQASGHNYNNSSSVSNSTNKYKPAPIVSSIVESPRSPYSDLDLDDSAAIQVTELGLSPRGAGSPAGSQRIQLAVNTGSGRIVMIGDVNPDELCGESEFESGNNNNVPSDVLLDVNPLQIQPISTKTIEL